MFAVLLTLASLGSAVPQGARLHPDHACYTIFVSAGGQARPIGVTLQTIVRDRAAGRAIWRIVVHQRLANGRFDMRDSFVLDAATLRPISLSSTRNGQPHAMLAYEPGRVTGRTWGEDGAEHRVDQVLAGPVWDGNLFGPTFAALPLAEGKSFELPIYQYDHGVGAFTVRVKGFEVVSTPAGPVDAWVLDAGASPSERLDYLIAKHGHRELGYRSAQGEQRLGGDCSNIE